MFKEWSTSRQVGGPEPFLSLNQKKQIFKGLLQNMVPHEELDALWQNIEEKLAAQESEPRFYLPQPVIRQKERIPPMPTQKVEKVTPTNEAEAEQREYKGKKRVKIGAGQILADFKTAYARIRTALTAVRVLMCEGVWGISYYFNLLTIPRNLLNSCLV